MVPAATQESCGVLGRTIERLSERRGGIVDVMPKQGFQLCLWCVGQAHPRGRP